MAGPLYSFTALYESLFPWFDGVVSSELSRWVDEETFVLYDIEGRLLETFTRVEGGLRTGSGQSLRLAPRW